MNSSVASLLPLSHTHCSDQRCMILSKTPPIKSHFLSGLTTSRFSCPNENHKSTADKRQALLKTCFNPLTPRAHSSRVTSPVFGWSHAACDFAFSAASASVRHICSDSYDECETETPALAYTQENDESQICETSPLGKRPVSKIHWS